MNDSLLLQHGSVNCRSLDRRENPATEVSIGKCRGHPVVPLKTFESVTLGEKSNSLGLDRVKSTPTPKCFAVAELRNISPRGTELREGERGLLTGKLNTYLKKLHLAI